MKNASYVLVLFSITLAHSAQAARLKDLAALKGVRNNQLLGYGVVVGLSGTGDKSLELTENSLSLALKTLGVDMKSKKLETQNAAAVVVSAELPPFTRIGTRLDATLSSVGTASSLQGGTLLMTSLRGPDGRVYAMAQGKVVTVKQEGSGQGGSNPLTTAEIIQGALVEKEITFDFAGQKELRYNLKSPDFTTAARIAHRVNEELGGKYATALDAGTVTVIPPYSFEGSPVDLVAQIEAVDVEADTTAKVVINTRTGVVVLGEHVRVSPVAIAHHNVKVEIAGDGKKMDAVDNNTGGGPQQETPGNAQGMMSGLPPGQAPGKLDLPAPPPTAAGPAGKKGGRQIALLNHGAKISDIVNALNEMGVSADDLVSIIQSLKASGALVADVQVQ